MLENAAIRVPLDLDDRTGLRRSSSIEATDHETLKTRPPREELQVKNVSSCLATDSERFVKSTGFMDGREQHGFS